MRRRSYLYIKGLYELAKTLQGDEKVHLGIRPYQLHAGNILSIGVYPYLLCEAIKKRGITPSFTFLVSLNDWEQDELVGEDIYNYIFDVRPKHTTIQYLKTVEDKDLTTVWQHEISKELDVIKQAFPNITISYIRNSELRNQPLMHQALLHTIQHRDIHKKTLLQATKRQTNGTKTYFANAVCEKCYSVDTNSKVIKDKNISITCAKCGYKDIRFVGDFNYWFYHKELFSARLAILDFEISISGSDHYAEGDYESREALFKLIYNKPFPRVKMLFAPILLAYDGNKMSKSRANFEYRSLQTLLPYARNCSGSTISMTDLTKEPAA